MDVRPGVLDGAAERAFSYGACAGLAIALHDATGWPLVKVTDAHSVFFSGTYTSVEDADVERRARAANQAGSTGGLHWLVAHPNGRLVDVDGFHDPVGVVETYDNEADDGVAALGHASRADAVEEYVDAKGAPVPLDVCATFVEAVLKRLR